MLLSETALPPMVGKLRATPRADTTPWLPRAHLGEIARLDVVCGKDGGEVCALQPELLANGGLREPMSLAWECER